MKIVVVKAPWCAVSVSRWIATALSFGIKAAALLRFAAALKGASRIFMRSSKPEDHEVRTQNETLV
jgi:hypothetical protein